MFKWQCAHMKSEIIVWRFKSFCSSKLGSMGVGNGGQGSRSPLPRIFMHGIFRSFFATFRYFFRKY